MASNIWVGLFDHTFWVKVEGRGTFQNSVHVRMAMQNALSKGATRIVMDLEKCPIMDSTFLGTLTGIASRLPENESGGGVHILHANPRNLQLLHSLGLDYILQIHESTDGWADELIKTHNALSHARETPTISELDQAKHVLEAHRSLTEVHEENAERFQDVIEFLEKEIDRHESEES